MPSPYATKTAMPASTLSERKVLVVTARNGAMVQDREATAYATPYRTIDVGPPVGAAPRILGRRRSSSRPLSSQTPSPTSRTPTTTVAHER